MKDLLYKADTAFAFDEELAVHFKIYIKIIDSQFDFSGQCRD